jgi:hypothetical protein
MPPVSFRAVEANNAPNIAPDFGSDSRRIKGRISGYATLDATQKPDQKTSEMGPLFISTALRNDIRRLRRGLPVEHRMRTRLC